MLDRGFESLIDLNESEGKGLGSEGVPSERRREKNEDWEWGYVQPTSSRLNNDEAVTRTLLILSSTFNLSAHKHEKVSETLFFSPNSIQGVLT